MDPEKYPTKHKSRVKRQLMKLLIEGHKIDKRTASFFLKYRFAEKNQEGQLKITQIGLDFLNWNYFKSPIERFLDKVEKTDSCWIWKAHCNQKGYGMFHFGKEMSAHRFSYLFHKGEIPEGMCVCHNCPGGDNPKCVNPDHLWLGSHADNKNDSCKKNRQAFLHGSKNGNSKLEESNIIEIRKLLSEGIKKRIIANRYNVNRQTIVKIENREYWKHVP